MTVNECTVSDATGNISDVGNKKIVGTIVTATDGLFSFYALMVTKSANGTGSSQTVQTVKIVMPLGGTQAGLFRIPRVGEKVLVGTEVEGGTAARYLMGYIPTTNDFQTTGMSQNDGRGEVFRYQQTGKLKDKAGKEEYSEIGFYHRPTSWKPADPDSYQDKSNDYPLIDQINIHSTGDIHESAVNYHQIQAKRLELLADEKKPDPVDPAKFKGGDIHIKAGEDITIEAGGSITLKVGRGSITISDDGVSIKHQLSNVVANPFDAFFSLSVRQGISMAGQTVDISGRRKWGITDKLGATVSGTAGVVNLKGRELDISTILKPAQWVSNASYGLDFLLACASVGVALGEENETSKGNKYSAAKNYLIAQCVFKWMNLAVNAFASIWTKYRPGKKKIELMDAAKLFIPESLNKEGTLKQEKERHSNELDHEDVRAAQAAFDALEEKNPLDANTLYTYASNYTPYERAALALDLVLELSNTVYEMVESHAKLTGKAQDDFNYSTIIIDNGIVLILSSIMIHVAGPVDGTAALSLGFDGSITAKTAKGQEFYAVTKGKAAATETLVAKWVTGSLVFGGLVPTLIDVASRISSTIELSKNIDEWDVPPEEL